MFIKVLFYIVTISLFMLFSCKKENETTDPNFDKISSNIDSIYMYSEQIYLWNNNIAPFHFFQPRKLYNKNLSEIDNYKNLILEISKYGKNNLTGQSYEFNPTSPFSPKYSTIIDSKNKESSLKENLDYLKENKFGVSLSIYQNREVYFLYVDKNSPAGVLDIKRGDRILSIDDLPIDNIDMFINKWMKAVINNFVKLSIIDHNNKTRIVRLTGTRYTANPLLKNVILESNKEKFGFIAYNSFTREENSINILAPIFSNFNKKGISKLIIDLRYNVGGYQNTVKYIANQIAPSNAAGKVMFTEHYNKIMQEGKATILQNQLIYDDYNRPIYINNRNATLYDVNYSVKANTTFFKEAEYSSSFKKIYFIVSKRTASASELLINVLKPYIDVEVIGVSVDNSANVHTYGKPIGFFDINIDLYKLFLAMYQIKNANNEGDYFEGIKADHSTLDDFTTDFGTTEDLAVAYILSKTNNKNESSTFRSAKSDVSSTFIFNTDRLQGNIKTTSDLILKE